MAEMTQRSCSSCTSLWQCSRSLRSRRPRSNRNSGACRLVGSESSVASNTSVATLSPSGGPATRPSACRLRTQRYLHGERTLLFPGVVQGYCFAMNIDVHGYLQRSLFCLRHES
ncbi:hypothetical protein HETIRDRAFT_418295 [Heterobasidion irregulare TC 32-1]|uniref:Uncharacterized protein n=1 Tax=Heterobasidion irregulare (strain TC 32-1) TaxID=747525 RepID=W4K358_HETIT|nr:uncharacterized protein HETIRDRAFT_418295 [Heterobasidion irregulare TC 32-1]ETW80257.1 hypothetical protein HETIRDRAFT_418295 [Heterobasidion irregulare TC 32-1]